MVRSKAETASLVPVLHVLKAWAVEELTSLDVFQLFSHRMCCAAMPSFVLSVVSSLDGGSCAPTRRWAFKPVFQKASSSKTARS
eukprot:6192173-Pleurochrysis_carterae.AAC.1